MTLKTSNSSGTHLTPAKVILELGGQEIQNINLPVPKRGSVKEIALDIDNFRNKKTLIDFDKYSTEKTGHKLLRVEVKKDPKSSTERVAKAVFSEGCYASFQLRYVPKDKTCKIEYAYRRGLPTWTQIGDKKNWLSKEKGIPTAKVILSLLVKALRINPYNVEKISLVSLSAQTTIDVIHSAVVEKKSFTDGFLHSASSLLASELGDMLGGDTLLTYVGSPTEPTCYSLSEFFILEKDLIAFKEQKKIKELFELTGYDFQEESQKSYPTLFHMRFSLTPRIKLADLFIPTLWALKKGDLRNARAYLRYLKKLSPEAESCVYRHFYEIHKRKNLIKQKDLHYGRKVFEGDKTLCSNSGSVTSDRIAAIEATIKELSKR